MYILLTHFAINLIDCGTGANITQTCRYDISVQFSIALHNTRCKDNALLACKNKPFTINHFS